MKYVDEGAETHAGGTLIGYKKEGIGAECVEGVEQADCGRERAGDGIAK